MDVSTMSTAELEGALLAPAVGAMSVPCVQDAAADQAPSFARSSLLSRQLSVARELLLRTLRARMQSGPILDSPQEVRDWLRLYCMGLEREVFVVLYLNTSHALIEAVQLFSGTLMQTSVYPREVVKEALARNAAAVIFSHNHPSGSSEPSRADQYLTQTLKSALAMVDVRVIDHFVVGGDRMVSFAERGLI